MCLQSQLKENEINTHGGIEHGSNYVHFKLSRDINNIYGFNFIKLINK